MFSTFRHFAAWRDRGDASKREKASGVSGERPAQCGLGELHGEEPEARLVAVANAAWTKLLEAYER